MRKEIMEFIDDAFERFEAETSTSMHSLEVLGDKTGILLSEIILDELATMRRHFTEYMQYTLR